MTDEELFTYLVAMQSEAYKNKQPFCAAVIQKIRHRFEELRSQNEKLQIVDWALRALKIEDEKDKI